MRSNATSYGALSCVLPGSAPGEKKLRFGATFSSAASDLDVPAKAIRPVAKSEATVMTTHEVRQRPSLSGRLVSSAEDDEGGMPSQLFQIGRGRNLNRCIFNLLATAGHLPLLPNSAWNANLSCLSSSSSNLPILCRDVVRRVSSSCTSCKRFPGDVRLRAFFSEVAGLGCGTHVSVAIPVRFRPERSGQ